METLAMDVHMVWMKEMSGLMTSGAIAATQDIELQREFSFLSQNQFTSC
jgi:hypothetical protein